MPQQEISRRQPRRPPLARSTSHSGRNISRWLAFWWALIVPAFANFNSGSKETCERAKKRLSNVFRAAGVYFRIIDCYGIGHGF
jgi:hypothetical protein